MLQDFSFHLSRFEYDLRFCILSNSSLIDEFGFYFFPSFFLICQNYARTKAKSIHVLKSNYSTLDCFITTKKKLFSHICNEHASIKMYNRASVGQQPSKKFDSHVLLLRPLSASLSLEFRLSAAFHINSWKCLLVFLFCLVLRFFVLCNQSTSRLHI